MRPRDTTPTAYRTQLEIYRQMSASERLALGLRLSADLQRVVADGVRFRHPEYDTRMLEYSVRRLRLGTRSFGEAYPREPLVAP